MSLSSLIASASSRGQAARHEAFSKPVKIGGIAGSGIYSELSHYTRLAADGGGMETDFSTALRIKKSDWSAYNAPSSFDRAVIELPVGTLWKRFRVAKDGVQDFRLADEWRLRLVLMN